jgi:aspartate/methionine/tyrosine aminotransferase
MEMSDFLLERYFARHEFSAPYLLCASDCETWTTQEILDLEDGARERYLALRLGYTQSAGSPDLRAAIAALYETIDPEDVLVFSGAEEAILAFMSAVPEAGHHLLAPHPAYQSLQEVALSRRLDITRIVPPEEDGWRMTASLYLDQCQPETRVAVINCPHNPSGGTMPADEFRRLIDECSDRSITVFSDEVYRLLEYDESTRLPSACDCSPTAVSLGVMSKAFGLAGLRIGWLATHDREILRRCAAFKDYTTICSSAPSEFLATVALKHGQRIAERSRSLIVANLVLLDDFFARRSGIMRWQRPTAGPIAFPRLLGEETADVFCGRALREAGVLLLPSSLYQFGDRHFRIGFGRANMPEALARLDAWLE